MSIFSTDGKLYKAMVMLTNIVTIQFCWLICCLPVVTAGAATVAAYTVIFRVIDGTEGYVFKDFFKAFAQNWKQGTILWLITAVAIYALYLDAQILTKSEDPSIALIVVSIVSFAAVFFSLLYAYPLCAKYENKFYKHIQNSFLLATQHIGKTLLLLLVLAVEIGACLWNKVTLILLLIVGPAIFMCTVAGTAKKIFAINDQRVQSE
ncbi:MAG: YesL family protein [Treponema sp.]|nr:YesL family protein [Treponema sp.]